MSNDRSKGSKKTKKGTTSPRSVGFKYFETEKILKILICIFLFVSTFVVYVQVHHHDFLNYDNET